MIKKKKNQLSLAVPLYSPTATAATVNNTNRFLLRKPLRLSLLMEQILSFMLPALLSMALRRRLLRSPLSGKGGLSASSFRKRLALLGGFSFIISSSTWSRREASWETRKISLREKKKLSQSSPFLVFWFHWTKSS